MKYSRHETIWRKWFQSLYVCIYIYILASNVCRCVCASISITVREATVLRKQYIHERNRKNLGLFVGEKKGNFYFSLLSLSAYGVKIITFMNFIDQFVNFFLSKEYLRLLVVQTGQVTFTTSSFYIRHSRKIATE